MKLYGQIINAQVLTRKKEESKKEAGKFYYKIGVLFPETEEVGEISCSEEIFNNSETLKGKLCNFDFVYNTDFKSISLYSIEPAKK